MQKERIQWIDNSKLIGIWLVILGHTNILKEYQSYIYSFHIPLFFFISGYVYQPKYSYLKEQRKNIVQLIWPYFTLYLIIWILNLIIFTFGYFFVTGKWNQSFSTGIIKPFLGLFYGVGYDTETSFMACIPLWFLLGLFFNRTFLNTIHLFSKNTGILILSSLIMLFLSQFLKFHNIDLYWSIDSAMIAFPFFIFGHLSNKLKLLVLKNKIIIFALVGLIFLLLSFTSQLNGATDINANRIGNNVILFLFNGVIGSIGIIYLSLIFEKPYQFISTLSQNTIIILAFHVIPIILLNLILPYWLSNIYTNIVISLVILLIMIFPIRIINRYTPILLKFPYSRHN